MRIIVRAEKGGHVLAQSEAQLKGGDDPMTGARRAFKAFRTEHPNVSLLDEDVVLRFVKVEAAK